MDEYIEKKAAIEAIKNDCLEQIYYSKEDAIWCIKATPAADVVEVVRCRDCKHSDIDDFDGSLWCCRDAEREVVEKHFCSYGERRAE